jgi:hypothetical protein
VAANVTTSPFTVASHTRLFDDTFDATMPHRNYDVSPDGKRFLQIASSQAATPEVMVVLNWLARLREQLARERQRR